MPPQQTRTVDEPGDLILKEPAAETMTSTIDPGLEEVRGRTASLEQVEKSLEHDSELTIKFETLYCIDEGLETEPKIYTDEPSWIFGPRGESVLTAQFPVPDVDRYLKEKHNLAFTIEKTYLPDRQAKVVRKAFREKKALPKPEPYEGKIRFESQDMKDAIAAFYDRIPNVKKKVPNIDPRVPWIAPYVFWYHYKGLVSLKTLAKSMKKEQLQRNVVSYKSMDFLIKPGDPLVWKDKGKVEGVISETSPQSLTPQPFFDDD
ncbi:hypothetical protein P154DRAFT_580394 [Amniculicola lignicola CBS 123094]|uniref:Uncharacterized protein n=1 Tax=Amniculicola lignicola CBS 123094 TaxID=1392246 RepID=A0A6A5W245_9PLEO|nr:hypothetical protein P154DRAFT_580394 [Amniculicola lignicola CBS 123094]